MHVFMKHRSFTLPCAMALLVAFAAWGCAKKDPVSAASSGLKPAEKQTDADKNGGNRSPDDKSPRGKAGETRTPRPDKPNPHGQLADVITDDSAKPAADDDFDYTVPKGSSAERVAFINKVTDRINEITEGIRAQFERSQAPSRSEQAKFGEQLQRLTDARIAAAEAILDDPQATAEQRRLAAETAVASLAQMAEAGHPTAREQLMVLARKLESDKDEEISRLSTPLMLSDELMRLEAKDPEAPAKVVKLLKSVLDQEPKNLGLPHLEIAHSTATALLEAQQPAAAAQVLRLIGERFADSPDQQAAKGARQLASQAFMIEVDDPLRRLMADKPGAKEDLLTAAKGAIEREQVELRSLEILERVAAHIQADHGETSAAIVEVIREGVDKLLASDAAMLSDMTAIGAIADSLRSDHPQTAEKFDKQVRAGVDRLLAGDQATALELVEVLNWAQATGQDAELVQSVSKKIVPAAEREIAKAKAEKTLAPTLSELLGEVAGRLEQTGQLELAAGVCDAVSKAIDQSSDAEEFASLKERAADAKKRLALVGQPFTVSGVTLDGKPLDWKKYQGKVVLVDFWASWCGPCLQEIPNIYDNYEKYREKGFEVVGVNMDDNLQDVEQLFSRRGDLPWPSVVSDDPEQRGAKNPLARKCGVYGIPFVVLVGADGKVLDIHVRGEKLGEKLMELLGPPVEETEPEAASPRSATPMPPTP